MGRNESGGEKSEIPSVVVPNLSSDSSAQRLKSFSMEFPKSTVTKTSIREISPSDGQHPHGENRRSST